MKQLGKITLYSREDVCKLLNLGTKKSLQLFHKDDFPAIKIGRSWWVEETALLEYIQNRHILTR